MSQEKLLKRIQMRLLPPSSRSFQSGHVELKNSQIEIRKKLEALELKNRSLEEKIDSLLRSNVQLLQEVQKLQDANSARYFYEELLNNVRINRKHMQYYAEGLYKKDNESIRTARIRFFSQLPVASGDIRLHQQVNAKLMEILDFICKKYNISYWFGYASLLGAYTRHSCIPWDDDIDICMMRQDLLRLKEILKNNNKCQLTLVYDYGVKVKQYRFSLKDANILSFIDIGVWDWATRVSEKNEAIIKSLRCELMQEIENSNELSYWRARNYLFAPGSGYVVQWCQVDYENQDNERTRVESETIEHIFEKYQKKAYDKGILCDETEANAVAYGLDNILESIKRPMLYKKTSIFPTQEVEFEQIKIQCPADISGFLDACYTDWPYLPQDILGGHDHFEKVMLEDRKVQKAMQELLDEDFSNVL